MLACILATALSLTMAYVANAQEPSAEETPAGRSVSPSASMPARQAIEEGNGQFAIGELELALELYRAGYDVGAPHPTLVYNLATTFHHLDRLPEAILWYRRGDPEDPWLEENLWLARRSLGTQRLNLQGPLQGLMRFRGPILIAAIVLAWLTLIPVFLAAKNPRALWALAAAVALTLYLTATITAIKGPREAVLLEDCSSSQGELPAGTELWVWPSQGAMQEVAGVDGMSCATEKLTYI